MNDQQLERIIQEVREASRKLDVLAEAMIALAQHDGALRDFRADELRAKIKMGKEERRNAGDKTDPRTV